MGMGGSGDNREYDGVISMCYSVIESDVLQYDDRTIRYSPDLPWMLGAPGRSSEKD